MHRYVIFCWLHIVVVLVLANVTFASSTVVESEEVADLSKKKKRRARSSANIRGSSRREIPEDEDSRLLFVEDRNNDTPPERKERRGASKDNFKLVNNAVTWRERLFPPSAAPSMAPSQSPSSSPTGEEDKQGYFHEYDRPIRVACAGDSLTRGTFGGQPWDSSYPYQLQEMLGEKFEVVNYGVNSATAVQGLPSSYVDTGLFKQSLALEPDIYLLMLGTNDAKTWEENGRNYRRGMEWIVKKVRSISIEASRPPRVIVAIPPWAMKDVYGIQNDVMVNSVQPAIRNVATVENLQLVNMYDIVTLNQTDIFVGDGLHLNKKGYRSLAAAWRVAMQCNDNGICEAGENCVTCPGDCYLNCS